MEHLSYVHDYYQRCCCCACGRSSASLDEAAENLPVVIGDTCSGCHVAALKQSIGDADYQVIYASFHVDVSETPFFVAVDYDHQSVVVSIRGTISMKVLECARVFLANYAYQRCHLFFSNSPIKHHQGCYH